jgi:hypothetical protein
MQAKHIPFHELCDRRGRLIFFEEGGGCPFRIGEIRWLKPADGMSQRAEWVASDRQELLIALRGAVNVRIISAESETEAQLDVPNAGLLVDRGVRCSLQFLTPGATVLRLIASKS